MASDGYESFDDVTIEDVLARITTALAEGMEGDPLEDRQNDATSVGDLLNLAQTYTAIRYIGYQIHPPRRDVRVSVEGFTCTALTADQVISMLLAFGGADETEAVQQLDGTYNVRFWWD